MVKKVDIDGVLAESRLEITLMGKTYEVHDIPMDDFFKAVSGLEKDEPDREFLKKQLAQILNVDSKELKGLGLKTASLAIRAIQEWVLEREPGEAGGKDEEAPSTP